MWRQISSSTRCAEQCTDCFEQKLVGGRHQAVPGALCVFNKGCSCLCPLKWCVYAACMTCKQPALQLAGCRPRADAACAAAAVCLSVPCRTWHPPWRPSSPTPCTKSMSGEQRCCACISCPAAAAACMPASSWLLDGNNSESSTIGCAAAAPCLLLLPGSGPSCRRHAKPAHCMARPPLHASIVPGR